MVRIAPAQSFRQPNQLTSENRQHIRINTYEHHAARKAVLKLYRYASGDNGGTQVYLHGKRAVSVRTRRDTRNVRIGRNLPNRQDWLTVCKQHNTACLTGIRKGAFQQIKPTLCSLRQGSAHLPKLASEGNEKPCKLCVLYQASRRHSKP